MKNKQRNPKKAWYGYVLAGAKTVSDATTMGSQAKIDRTLEAAKQNGGRLDTNALASAEAIKNAVDWNPVTSIGSIVNNKDMDSSDKWAATANKFGLSAVSGIVNLFDKDMSAKDKAMSFIPFYGAKANYKKAAEKAQKRMMESVRFENQMQSEKKRSLATQESNLKQRTSEWRKGGKIKKAGKGLVVHSAGSARLDAMKEQMSGDSATVELNGQKSLDVSQYINKPDIFEGNVSEKVLGPVDQEKLNAKMSWAKVGQQAAKNFAAEAMTGGVGIGTALTAAQDGISQIASGDETRYRKGGKIKPRKLFMGTEFINSIPAKSVSSNIIPAKLDMSKALGSAGGNAAGGAAAGGGGAAMGWIGGAMQIGTQLATTDWSKVSLPAWGYKGKNKVLKKGGVIPPGKLIEVQKGEVLMTPDGQITTAKELAKAKGIPERTHNQVGLDPQQGKPVTGIQIPKPVPGTIVYGGLKNPLSGRKFQQDATEIAKDYQKAVKKASNPNSTRLGQRTAALNAINDVKALTGLGNIQEGQRRLNKAKKAYSEGGVVQFYNGGGIDVRQIGGLTPDQLEEYNRLKKTKGADTATKYAVNTLNAQGKGRGSKGGKGNNKANNKSNEQAKNKNSDILNRAIVEEGLYDKSEPKKAPSTSEIGAWYRNSTNHEGNPGDLQSIRNSDQNQRERDAIKEEVKEFVAQGVAEAEKEGKSKGEAIKNTGTAKTKNTEDAKTKAAGAEGTTAPKSADTSGATTKGMKTAALISAAGSAVSGIGSGIINLIAAKNLEKTNYDANDYKNNNLDAAIDAMARGRMNIDPELSANRSDQYAAYRALHSRVGQHAGFYAANQIAIQAQKAKADAAAYARKHNHDLQVSHEIAKMRAAEGERMASVRGQVDQLNAAEAAGQRQMEMEGWNQIAKGVGSAANSYADYIYKRNALEGVAKSSKGGIIRGKNYIKGNTGRR